MNEHPSPEFEKELNETLGAPAADPVFVHDLRAKLLERSKMKQHTPLLPRLGWALALALLLIGLLAASPQIAQALEKLLGYVPGIGYVEPGDSLRVLAAPSTLEKDGFTVTVDNGVAETGRTVLFEQVQVPAGYSPIEPTNGRICTDYARLVLPDGTVIALNGYLSGLSDRGASSGDVYEERFDFDPLPAGALEATLELPCLLHDPDVTDFNIPLHFRAATKDDVLPVIDVSTPSAPASSGPSAGSPAAADQTVEGFSILIENETALPDGYILAGSFTWTDPRFDGFSVSPRVVEFIDAAGREVDVEPVDPGVMNPDPAVRKLPFAYQVHGTNYTWPLTIKVTSLNVTLTGEGTFEFDPGPDPQVNQSWDMNVDVPVAGRIVHVRSVRLIQGRTPAELGYEFVMTSPDGVTSAGVSDAHPIYVNGGSAGGGGGGGGGSDSGSPDAPFSMGWVADGYSPAGLKTFVVSSPSVLFDGLWQAGWQPANP